MKKLGFWLGAVTIVTIVFGTSFALVQHVLRSSVNDPQVQLAYDAASHLASGATVESLTQSKFDAGTSLAPFLTIYNRSGSPIAGTGLIDGKLTAIPVGVLQAADKQGYHAVTWQPKTNLRFAAVAVAEKDYYVVSSRSLYLAEKRIDELLLITICGWGAAILTLLVMMALSRKRY